MAFFLGYTTRIAAAYLVLYIKFYYIKAAELYHLWCETAILAHAPSPTAPT